MMSNKLSGSGKRLAKLTWTHDMRLTLDILTQIHGLDWATRCAAFNAIYDDHIKGCGYVEAVPSKTLRSQCSAGEKKKNKDWIDIVTLPLTPEEVVKIRSLGAQVEATLASLSVPDNGDGLHLSAIQRNVERRIPAPRTPSPRRQIPLSERTPIAYWDPQTIPQRAPKRPLQRKRSRPAITTDRPADSDHDNDVRPRSKRRRLVVSKPRILRRSELDAAILTTPVASSSTASQVAASPQTPNRIARRYLPKSPYHRPEDITLGRPPLQLTANEHARAKEPMIPVTSERAHPPIPALCYRYWPAEAGQLRNRETGFLARRFARCVPMYQPPPRAEEICWTDIWDHINRNEVPTPFVSVSTAFWWIIRLALKEAQKGAGNGMISVIDTSRIDPRAIFHAPPYHAQTKKKFVYRDGAQRYPGTHEYLVWREIPGDAIIKTLKVSDILRFATANPIIGQALAFDLLPQRGAHEARILPELRARNIELNPAIITGIAKLSHLLGLGLDSTNQLSHIVSDIIQGWAIKLPRLTSPEWATHASTFEKALGGQLSMHSQEAKLGFLDGVRWGASKHWNTRHSVENMRLMQRQAKAVGVDDPVKILADDLDAAKVRLRMIGGRQTRLLRSSLGQNAGGVEEEDENGGSEDDIVFE